MLTVQGERISMTPNTFVIVPPHMEHAISDVVQTVTRLDVMFCLEDLLLSQVKAELTVCSEVPESVSSMLWDAKKEWDMHRPLHQLLAEYKFAESFITMLAENGEPHYPEFLPNIPALDGLPAQIRQYIEKNYCSICFSIDQMGKTLMYSPAYLSKIFKSAAKISITRYVNELRIEHSIKLMRETELPLSEICYSCGFRDIRYFSRVFKSLTGFTPREMRRKEIHAIHADQNSKEIIYRYYASERNPADTV